MRPMVLSVPTSSTGGKLSNAAFGMSGLEMLALVASSSYKKILPNNAMADRSGARSAALNDFDVKPMCTPGTVIANNENKKDETGNADKQSRSTTGASSSYREKQHNKCEICQRIFTRPASLRQHIQTAHNANPERFTCTRCDASFSRKSTLRQHEKKVHDMVPLPRCRICKQVFENEFLLSRHAAVHDDGPMLQCRFCDERFFTRDYLEQHERRDHDNIRFRCNTCHKKLANKASFDRHMRVHEVGKDKKCKECGACFVTRTELAHHRIDSHKKGEVFSCFVCSKIFTLKASLTRHLRIHQGTSDQVWREQIAVKDRSIQGANCT